MIFIFYLIFRNFSKQTENPQMGRRILRRHIWGFAVCLCPTKRMPGLNELNFAFVPLWYNIQVNNFSVMMGQSHRFLGVNYITESKCVMLKDETRCRCPTKS